MITRIHRIVLPLVITVLARSASGQASATASVDVTAQIISPITIASTHALDFGKVLNASAKTVAPNVAASARVEMSGASGSSVSFSVTMPTTLKATTGETITVGSWNYMLSTSATLAGATPAALTGGTPQTITAVIAGTGVSKLYLGFGATLQTSATAPTGNYTGTGQVTAAYADL